MSAIFKLTYGLFVLTARDGNKDNGCVVNTALQVTANPPQVSVCVNKANYTHDMIMKSGEFNVSILSQEAPFSVFQRFGMQCGRDVDKFDGFDEMERSANGLYYLTRSANAMLSIGVKQTVDVGTDTMFIGEVADEKELSDVPSVSYQYYFDHIKPKPETKKKGFVCKICGYVYEGDELPPDFICPICKHGVEAFEPIK